MSESFFGQQGVSDSAGASNGTEFQIRQALAQVRTNVPVKVIAVHGGGVAKPPTVDVQIMVNQTDGVGKKTDHGIIYGIAVARNQGGGNAIINDPIVGDVGLMAVADRDISALKSNDGAQSNPGSKRRHNLSDAIYQRGMLNPNNPDQFVHFRDDGVTLADRNGNVIEMNSGGIIKITGTLHVTGDVVAGFGGGSVSLLQHLHSGVVPGGGNTASPVPGT
nr:MAG TPA: baseplate protein [Caudoviricetes sp.]